MKSDLSKASRRKLLRSIAAGGGAVVAGQTLPSRWTKPVVDSVLLPAHAQTSAVPPGAGPGCPEPSLVRIAFTRPGSSVFNPANVITSTSFVVGEGDANTNYITAHGFFSDAPETPVYINAAGNLIWQSSDTSVAYTGSGPSFLQQQTSSSITAAGVGTATITATWIDLTGCNAQQFAASYTVTVTPA